MPPFAFAIFISAALLFLVQPLTGKLLLPLLGGSPSVWNTCMVFFQAVLLLGYLYSHLITKHLKPAAQAIVHVAVLGIAAISLPISAELAPAAPESPTRWLLQTLALTVGLPFFVVATTGPLIQRWFSRTQHAAAKDPYFLYAASNLGSVIGLLAYPIVLEPLLTREGQSTVWTLGYALLGIALVVCAALTLKASRAATRSDETAALPEAPKTVPLTWKRRALWVFYAFIPSSLMLGVTQHISTDIAAIPLLWIVPLLIYLASFIIAFSPRFPTLAAALGRGLPFAMLALLLVLVSGLLTHVLITVSIHLVVFALVATLAHRRLADDRPGVEHLTEFYLLMSVGGVLGGIFNALLAPIVFPTVLEYPIVLGLACTITPQFAAALPGAFASPKRCLRSLAFLALVAVACLAALLLAEKSFTANWAKSLASASATPNPLLPGLLRAALTVPIAALVLWRAGALRFALATLILAVGAQFVGLGGDVLYRERTFFGVHRVTSNAARAWNKLHHGTTLHGVQLRTQSLRPADAPAPPIALRDALFWGPPDAFTPNQRTELYYLLPVTYFHPSGPIGEVMQLCAAQGRLQDVAVIGLGTGSLASYGRPGGTFTFFEIDPAVARIANNPALFSFFHDSEANCAVYGGDGRLGMESVTDQRFDLVVIDAFSSDAIPVHLITLEAVQIYLDRLKPNGLITFHVSNRHFDLAPVLARLGDELHLNVYQRYDALITPQQAREAKNPSTWVTLARTPQDFAPLSDGPDWKRLPPDSRYPLWTDDYSNVMGVFVGW